jgi:hypothetical protein
MRAPDNIELPDNKVMSIFLFVYSWLDKHSYFFLQDTVFSHICQWTMVQGKRELDDYVVIEGGRWGELLVQLEQLDWWSLSMWV